MGTRGDFYRWLALMVASLTMGVLAIIISVAGAQRTVARERDARLASEAALCALIITQDDAYREIPPATATGRKLARDFAALRRTYECDGK